MSSLAQNRSLDKGTGAAALPAASANAPSARHTRRTTEEKPEGARARTATPRSTTSGTTAASRAATRTRAARAAGTAAGSIARASTRAKAAAQSPAAKAATAKAAGARAAVTKAAAAKVVPAKAAVAKAAGAKATTARTAVTKAVAVRGATRAAAKPAPAKTSVAKPAAAKPAVAKPAVAKPAVAKPAAAKPAAAKPTATKPMSARRPVPHPRTAAATETPAPAPGPVVEAVSFTGPAVTAAVTAAVAPAVTALRPERRVLVAPRRRPATFLAAALVGALGIGLFGAPSSVAEAHAPSAPDHTVGVAHALGLAAKDSALSAPAATRQLSLLAAGRAERQAERTAAAQAQDAADQAAIQASIEAARPKAVLPVTGGALTSGFGMRWGTLHAGIDLAAPLGTPEYAAMDGVVLKAGPASGFGQAVYIQHANGDVTVYGHMEKILVQTGQVVKAGDTIALLGAEGQATGPHLHFEVHVGGIQGQKIDPIPWLRDRGVQI
jgi:hypothetical protein